MKSLPSKNLAMTSSTPSISGARTDRKLLASKFTLNLEAPKEQKTYSVLPGDITARVLLPKVASKIQLRKQPSMAGSQISQVKLAPSIKLPSLGLGNTKNQPHAHFRTASLAVPYELDRLQSKHSRQTSQADGESARLQTSFHESQKSSDTRQPVMNHLLAEMDEVSSVDKPRHHETHPSAVTGRDPLHKEDALASRSLDASGDEASSANALLLHASKSNDQESSRPVFSKLKRIPIVRKSVSQSGAAPLRKHNRKSELQEVYIKRLEKEKKTMCNSLESNVIFARSWIHQVEQSHRSESELAIQISKCTRWKDRLHTMLKHKLQNIVLHLRVGLRTIASDLLTQYSLLSIIEPIREEVSSSFSPSLCLLVLRMSFELCWVSKNKFLATEHAIAGYTIADIFFESKDLLFWSKMLGNCYRDRRMYQESLDSFKKFLLLAWIQSDMIEEFNAFDSIGMCYFYLADKRRSHQFHYKAMTGDSELENTDLMNSVKLKHQIDRKKRTGFLQTKDVFYRFNLMKTITRNPAILKDKFLSATIAPFLSSNSQFDESALKPVPESNTKIRIVSKPNEYGEQLREAISNQYKANFTEQGMLECLRKSNPSKYSMVESGQLKLHANSLSGIDLKGNFDTSKVDSTYLTHLSQNKSAESFVNCLEYKGTTEEVCLEYISPDIKPKLKAKLQDYLVLFDTMLFNLRPNN